MSDPAGPPAVRRLAFPWGTEALLVRCPECGTYGSATDPQVEGREPWTCPIRWCGTTTQQDRRPAIPAPEPKE